MAKATLVQGNCVDHMRSMDENSIDAIVTDPPYAFPGGFMGRAWDKFDGREDAAFGYWLAGFIDGEGCFRVQRHERGTHTCTFSLKIRRDDRAVLERMKRFLGCGTIVDSGKSDNKNPTSNYVIQNKEGCDRLVTVLRKYPLVAKKQQDFEEWANAVEEWLDRPRGNRWIGAADQKRATIHKEKIEKRRNYVDPPWSGHKFQDWCRIWAEEAYRVLKPGGHMLAFGSTKNHHRLVCGLEDAGFEVRDTVMWLHSLGFPKSLDIGKQVEGYEGFGTNLKPSFEPVVLVRKPLIGTVVQNVLEYGTGGINIDECRVEHANDADRTESERKNRHTNYKNPHSNVDCYSGKMPPRNDYSAPQGRWPANTIFSHTDECTLVGSGEVKARVINRWADGAKPFGGGAGHEFTSHKFGDENGMEQVEVWECSEDCPVRMLNEQSGATASRFFYCSKANKKERNAGVADANNHATVKPIEIMRYLVRLITPPGGIVLDPFMGSGTTLIACLHEGFDSIGIELEEDHMRIAEQRVAYWREQIYGT